MKRRSFLKLLAAAPAAPLVFPRFAEAALPKTSITRVRIYKPPDLNQLFNQSNMLVTVETEAGITGIGEGGAKDTLEQCAGSLIGKLVENHDIDFNRCTLPNVGGITELLKIMAMCETHAVGMVPHFTGPVATAALVNCLATYPGTVLFEYNYGDRKIPYLPEYTDFKSGKLYPNERPGLGVTLDVKPLTMIGEVTQPVRRQIYRRPDGSLTHW